MTQKALIVRTGPDGHEGLDELNLELERGWRVHTVSPMGGAGDAEEAPSHAALVVLERRDADGPTVAVEAVERAESEATSIVEEVMRGIGKVTGEMERGRTIRAGRFRRRMGRRISYLVGGSIDFCSVLERPEIVFAEDNTGTLPNPNVIDG